MTAPDPPSSDLARSDTGDELKNDGDADTLQSLRSGNINLLDERGIGTLKLSKRPSRPHLQARPTTALSLADAQSDVPDGESSPKSYVKSLSRRPSHAYLGRAVSGAASEAGDTTSVLSYAPSVDFGGPTESLLGNISSHPVTPAWKALSAQLEIDNPFDRIFGDDDIFSGQFAQEFDEVGDVNREGTNEELLLNEWKAKLKHYFIFSSSGKPIWSRHGDDQLISSYIGIIQTLVSFYQGAKDELQAFTAGDARFVVVSKGHLHLVAISKMGESDDQLRNQLESLYMQILSTLTLPSMEKMFLNRPSTDLRRPLQGTEVLLDALADGFTRGSPSTLLSSLECLKLRKSHRQVINSSLLKVRTPSLLYGLIVADARLVSVIRPKKHSLHPGDLHLVFNMLFEAGSIKAGGGENWIPLCLPGFNNTGYLYMYVSFINPSATLDVPKSSSSSNKSSPSSPNLRPPSSHSGSKHEDEVAIILISANKEAFFELRGMRDALLLQMKSNNSLAMIQHSMHVGRPTTSSIIPSGITANQSVIRHFLYKSRGNVQYMMPSYEPHFHTAVAKRRLMSVYGELSSALHSKAGKCKVVHSVGRDAAALAWETPLFELYIVAKPGTTRELLAKGANRVIHCVRREEERVFIIGGAVF
ncbi:Vacuolar fusion protein MON1 [Sphaceloma murrayae]|uniref:Vacuolar fusion protein MON1 n=1 Tax=Sphaceloma murrayae TaxID=2082308 RepID=A0A2K1R1Y1_9PEZI|nr:Vacuolar fusion protein MON1 [Sphaceloma murrayae]